MSRAEVDRELERMFWPEPKKRGRAEEPRGIEGALRLLMTSSRALGIDSRGADPSRPSPLSGGQLLRDELRSHLNGAPQVLVKITGKSRGMAGIRDHLRYIAGGKPEKDAEREGRAADEGVEPGEGDAARPVQNLGQRLVRPLTLETGEEVGTLVGLVDLQAEWKRGLASVPWTSDRAEAHHILFQMPAGTDARKLLDAARATAAGEFDGHRYAMALHLHQSTPHVHLIVRSANDLDGRRLNPRKEDLHRWRMRFAHELRERGVDAAASRQRTRGFAQRHEHLWEKKMEARAAGYRQRAARAASLGDARSAAELEAKAAAVRGTVPTRPRPSGGVTESQLRIARQGWDGLGRALVRSNDPTDQELGRRTVDFARRAFDGSRVEGDAAERTQADRRSSIPEVGGPKRGAER